MFYTNVPVILMLFGPAMLTREFENVDDFVERKSVNFLVMCLVAGSCIAVAYNLVTLMFIRTLSALYLSITGTTKVAIIIVLSVIFFGDELSPLNGMGTLVALIAFGYNSYLTYMEKQSQMGPTTTNSRMDVKKRVPDKAS